MGLIGDHGKSLTARGGKLAHLFQGKGEGLDRADHHFFIAAEGFCELAALAAVFIGDRGHHAFFAFKGFEGFLELGVDHVAITHHQHRIEDFLVLGVVEFGKEVGGPGDGVGFAGAGGMLHQVFLAWPFLQHALLQEPGDGELVVAGEKDPGDLLFLVALGDAIAAQDLQPAFAFPHLLPEVGGLVAITEGIAFAAVLAAGVAAFVEGQKHGAKAGEIGAHAHLAVAHGEMHQGATGEGEQGLGGLAGWFGVAIFFVLVDRVFDGLGVVGLEFDRGHRDAIEEQHQINAVLVVQRVLHLAHHPQAVGLVAGQDFGVEPQGWFELRHLEGLA